MLTILRTAQFPSATPIAGIADEDGSHSTLTMNATAIVGLCYLERRILLMMGTTSCQIEEMCSMLRADRDGLYLFSGLGILVILLATSLNVISVQIV